MGNIKEEFTITNEIKEIMIQGIPERIKALEDKPPFTCNPVDINIKKYSTEDLISNVWNNFCKDNGVHKSYKINNEALVLFLENESVSINNESYDDIYKIITLFISHHGFDYFLSFIQEMWEESIIYSTIEKFLPRIVTVANDLQKHIISDNIFSSQFLYTDLLDFILHNIMSKGIDVKQIKGEEFKNKVSETLEEVIKKEVFFQDLRNIVDELDTFKGIYLNKIRDENISIDPILKKLHLFIENNIPFHKDKKTQEDSNTGNTLEIETIALKAIRAIPEGRQEELITLITEFTENTKHQPKVPLPTNRQEMKDLGIETYPEFKATEKSTDGEECLNKNWGQFLKHLNPKLDRDYMSQADLDDLDKKLLRRLRNTMDLERLNSIIPSLPAYNKQKTDLMTKEEIKEIHRKNSLLSRQLKIKNNKQAFF